MRKNLRDGAVHLNGLLTDQCKRPETTTTSSSTTTTTPSTTTTETTTTSSTPETTTTSSHQHHHQRALRSPAGWSRPTTTSPSGGATSP